MTLAAAFRGSKGGILLCSDQEWNDAGVSKRQIDKNYRIRGLRDCEFFISGAGPDTAFRPGPPNLMPVIRLAMALRRRLYGIQEPMVWGVRANELAAFALGWLPSPAPKPMYARKTILFWTAIETPMPASLRSP